VLLADVDLEFGTSDHSLGGTLRPLTGQPSDWVADRVAGSEPRAAGRGVPNALEVNVHLARNADKMTRVRAMFDTAVTGFRPTAGRAVPMAPFALYDGPPQNPGSPTAPTGWSLALARNVDQVRRDPGTNAVAPGPDKLREVMVVIGQPFDRDPPVVPAVVLRLGTVTPVLDQLAVGLRPADLAAAPFRGEFSLLPDMTRPVGASASVPGVTPGDVAEAFDKLRASGEPRVWPLFADLTDDDGDPVVNGFTAARVLNVEYDPTRNETSVRVTLQEAVLATPTAVTRPAATPAGGKPPPPQKVVGKVRLAG
jgi:hypothetical protein